MTFEDNTIESVNTHIDYPQINNLVLLLFCGYVLTWYLQIGTRIEFLGAIRFELIYACILTFIALFLIPRFDIKHPLLPYIMMYFLAIIIQIPFSYDFNRSWEVFVDRIIKFSFMAFFIVSFVRAPKHLKFFLAAFMLACMKMGFEGYIGRITGGLVWENQGIMRLHGATPNYAHPNSFSGMALGTLPFIYFLWPLGNKYVKLLLLLLGLFSLNIIIYTGSRTGYIGIIAFIIYIFLLSNNKKQFLARFLLLSILVIPLIPSQYKERFDTIFADEEHEGGSEKARKEILKDAVQIFAENPFGIGVSAFPKKRWDTFGRIQDTHNLYLEIATNLGVQGLIIFGLLIYKLLLTLQRIKSFAANLITAINNDRSSHNKYLLDDLRLIEAVALATSAFVIIRLALGLFGMDLYEIYWWFAIGITLSLYSIMNFIQIYYPAASNGVPSR